MKHLFLALLGSILLLGHAPAWAFNPVAGVTVTPNMSPYTVPTPPQSGTPATDSYYTFLEVQGGARAIVNGGLYVQDVTVHQGGTLVFTSNAYIYQPVGPGAPSGAPNSTVTLEPGARLEIASVGDGLPFVPAGDTSSTYTVDIADNVHYLFNGATVQNPQRQSIFGNNVPMPTAAASITIDNPGGVILENNLDVSQEIHLTRGMLTVSAGRTLTLLSNSDASSLLDAKPGPGFSSSLNLLGSFVAQCYVAGNFNAGAGYRHLSAPVSGATVASFTTIDGPTFSPTVNPAYNTAPVPGLVTPFPTVFTYDQNRIGQAGVGGTVGFDQGWRSPSGLTGVQGALGNAQGYTVNMPGFAVMAFAGTPRTNAITIPNLNRSTDPDAGWQFLGNPYAAPINWDLMGTAANMPGMQRTLYMFRSSGVYSGAYSSYLPPAVPGGAGIGVNGGTKIVPLAQGFFVRTATAGATGTVNFNPNQLITSLDTLALSQLHVYRSAPDLRPRLRLSVQNAAASQSHETVVYFDAAATSGFDAAYDASYLPAPGQALALRTEAAGNAYSINGQPALSGADVLVPLHLTATAAGRYNLRTDELLRLPAGYHAYLRDALTGTLTDLAATTSLTLTLPANADTGTRYAVLFSTQAGALATAPAALAALASVYPNPAHGTATLLLPQALRGSAATPVSVLNALGQVVYTATQPATAETLALPLNGLASGIYTVQAHTAAGTVSRRLVVE